MKTEDKIKQAVNAFIEGGDKRNYQLLNKVLHAEFRSTINRFAGNFSLTIVPKEAYLSLIDQKKIGGTLRTITSISVESAGHVAAAKVQMQSEKLHFTSFYQLICNEDNEWQLVSDLPFISALS